MKTQLITDFPSDFLILETESKIEGFKFLEKMRLEWDSEKNRFNKVGEALYGVFEGDKLVAIGGINLDPYANGDSIGRVRHLYVLKAYRKHGLGTALVKKILEHCSKRFSKVRLRTDTIAASKFYEKFGFKAVSDDSASHQWIY